MWKVWITAFENVDFTYFSTFLPVENTVFVNYLTIAVGLCQVFFFLLKVGIFAQILINLCAKQSVKKA